jgi:PKD repeat protein
MDRPARRIARACITLVLLGLVVGAASAGAAPTDANWVLMNEQGMLANRFGTSETVLVTGSPVGGGGLFPSVDLYVVANRGWGADDDGRSLEDVSNAQHIPNTATGFEVVDLPLWFPYLRAGGYDMVVDRDENGVYDDEYDAVIGPGSEPGFTVFFDGNRRIIDKQALKEQYAAPWSHVAQQARVLTSMVNTFEVASEVTGARSLLDLGLIFYSHAPAPQQYPCGTTECSVTRTVKVVKDQAPGLHPSTTVAGALCGEVLGDSHPEVKCSALKDPTSAVSSASFGSKQLEAAAQNLQRVADGIYADPPDIGYDQVFPYTPPAQTFTPPSDLSPVPEQTLLANDLNVAAMRSVALLHAIERFDGAVQDGNDVAGGKQAAALAEQAHALAELLLDVKAHASTAADAMRASGVTEAQLPDLAALQQRLQQTGLTDTERSEFHAAGWTDEDLDELVAQVTAVPADQQRANVADVLDDIGGAADGAVPALWSLGDYAASIAATAPVSQPPTASFSSDVPDTDHPKSTRFDAGTSNDPDGSITTYTWDFGDGEAGSGTTPTHAYSHAGTYMVTLTVTDDSGMTATDQHAVQVDTTAPLALFSVTPESGIAPLDVAFDGSESRDPDGSIAGYAWDFGDGQTGSGVTPHHLYAFAGTYTATLTVTDDDGVMSSTSRTVALTGANEPPVASFQATPETGGAPLTVTFNGSGSNDSNGPIASWSWDFGDGATGDGPIVTHRYEQPGTYAVTLTVTDSEGQTAIANGGVVVAPNGAPTPAGDVIYADPTGTEDVLVNDSDPEADDLTLVATGAAGHGTVSCTPEGACLYTGDDGFQGDDTFDYTVEDSFGHRATATVTVFVSLAATAPSVLTAATDDVSTAFETAVDIDVLHNDSGPGTLRVTGAGEPQHGTVTCPDGGPCRYVPADGYSGADGFTYTVGDDAGATATGTVRVLVAPADAGAVLVGAGAAKEPPLRQGGQATWRAGSRATPDGVSDQELEALQRPELTADLDGRHAPVAGSVTTAKDWTRIDPAPAGHAFAARAEPGALLGEALSAPIPPPLPPLNQGTGGDGHVPVLVGTRVFAFFHHSWPTSISCVDRRTGLVCPGYPKRLPIGASNIIGPGAVVGSRIFVHADGTNLGTQRAPVALFCWDASRDRTCGMAIAARAPLGQNGASAPVLVDGRIYLAADGGKLLCVDPATRRPCAEPPLETGLPAEGRGEYDIVSHGTRVFATRMSSGLVTCLDVAAHARCPGWAEPHPTNGLWNVINMHDEHGATVGACVVTAGSGRCWRDDDPGVAHDLEGFPEVEDYYSVTLEAEAGTRTLMGSLSRGGLGCWDWARSAPCAGGGYDAGGWLGADANGAGLPSAYGAMWDGSCVVALGDPGLVFSVDPAGNAPCASLSTGTERQTIDLRDQRCDGTTGNARWVGVTLTDESATDALTSVVVTIRDAATGTVLATGDVAGPGGAVSLAGIDPAVHPAVTIDAVASAQSDGPWEDGVPPRIRVRWQSDPAQLCFTTALPLECDVPPAPVGLDLHGTLAPAGRKISLDVLRGPCNDAPLLDDPGTVPVDEQTTLRLGLHGTDPNGDGLRFALVDGPPGMAIDAASGTLTWTPSEDDGPVDVTVKARVTDDGSPSPKSAERSFVVRVREVNRPPALEPLGDLGTAVGHGVRIALVATDPDQPANALTFALVQAPEGASIDARSGVVTWTPAVAGDAAFTVRVSDDGTPALSTERRFAVHVAAEGVVPPTVDVTPPAVTVTPSIVTATSAAQQLRACSRRRLVLEDVVADGGHVRLLGIADPKLAGQRARIVFLATGKTVAQPTIGADGRFSATAPMPSAAVRGTNRARYRATVDADASQPLKLARRMVVANIAVKGRSATLTGRVTGPLAKLAKDRAIEVRRRLSCSKEERIQRVTPASDGRFRITVPLPAGSDGMVLRLTTLVRSNPRSAKLQRTYSLPRAAG